MFFFFFFFFFFFWSLYVVYYFDFHLVSNLGIFIREISKIHNTYLYGVDFSIIVVLGVVRTKLVFTNIGKYKPGFMLFFWQFGFFIYSDVFCLLYIQCYIWICLQKRFQKYLVNIQIYGVDFSVVLRYLGVFTTGFVYPTMESTNPHQDYRVEPLLRASDLCEGDVVLEVHVSFGLYIVY